MVSDICFTAFENCSRNLRDFFTRLLIVATLVCVSGVYFLEMERTKRIRNRRLVVSTEVLVVVNKLRKKWMIVVQVSIVAVISSLH